MGAARATTPLSARALGTLFSSGETAAAKELLGRQLRGPLSREPERGDPHGWSRAQGGLPAGQPRQAPEQQRSPRRGAAAHPETRPQPCEPSRGPAAPTARPGCQRDAAAPEPKLGRSELQDPGPVDPSVAGSADEGVQCWVLCGLGLPKDRAGHLPDSQIAERERSCPHQMVRASSGMQWTRLSWEQGGLGEGRAGPSLPADVGGRLLGIRPPALGT